MTTKYVLTLAEGVVCLLMAMALMHHKPVAAQPPPAGDLVSQPAEKREPASPPPLQFAALPEMPASIDERQPAIDQQLPTQSQADEDNRAEEILNEIATNSERKVRLAAIKAIKQTGDRDIIPALKDVAARVHDTGEKKALLEAADYLAQPVMREPATNLRPIGESTP